MIGLNLIQVLYLTTHFEMVQNPWQCLDIEQYEQQKTQIKGRQQQQRRR